MARVLEVAGCRLREWDSAFFGFRIAQVDTRRPASGAVTRIVRDADDAAIECLYWLVDAADATAIRAAEQNGFAMVDIRLTLACDRARARERVAGAPVRPALPGDVPALMALARASHRNTRFYRDPRFDTARCDELYATWIERSVAGELADAVWVVDVDSAARGYLTVKAAPGDVGPDGAAAASATIGLVAVDPAYRGRRYGDALVRTACAWTAQQGLALTRVVTQGNNADAIRFYERAGFVASRVELWYHRWRRS